MYRNAAVEIYVKKLKRSLKHTYGNRGLTLPEILGLLAVPPGAKFILRYEETVDAKRRLLALGHPHHVDVVGRDEQGEPVLRDVDETAAVFEHELFDFVGLPGYVEVPPVPAGHTGPLDWFVRSGPRLAQISSLVVPDEERTLPPPWAALARASPALLHLNMGCLIDPENQNGPSRPGRPVALDHSQWLQSRIQLHHHV